MRLGCCANLADIDAVKAAGFEFIEVNVQEVLRGDEPSSTWDPKAPDPAKLPLPIEAANVLIPAAHPIVGPKRDMIVLQDYMQRVAKRAQRLGIQRFVFGSGAARRRPDGFDATVAHQQIEEFTRMAGEVCSHHGVTLVIEHLHSGETNTINKLDQARALCDHVHHPNVAVLVDSYHYGLEHEHDQALLELGDRVAHVHVAEVDGRHQPGGRPTVSILGGPDPAPPPAAGDLAAGGYDFVHFFCLLRKIGYDGRVSVEAKWSAPLAEAGADCAALIRQAWDAAGRCET